LCHAEGDRFPALLPPRRIAGMGIVLSVMGACGAAVCIWATVRLIARSKSRRWIASSVAVAGVLLLAYSLSYGPFVALSESGRHLSNSQASAIYPIYWPIYTIEDRGPEPFKSTVRWYAHLWRGMVSQ